MYNNFEKFVQNNLKQILYQHANNLIAIIFNLNKYVC